MKNIALSLVREATYETQASGRFELIIDSKPLISTDQEI